jgi:hypothetical protein
MLRDDVDREHLREAVDTHGYVILAARTNATIDQLRNQLEQPADEAKTAFLRGQLAGLRLALKLPDMMLQEYEEARKQRKSR